MKLISLAALSFLAITVSAQSPKSTSTQSAEQHQSTVAPILQPYMDTTGENELQSQMDRIHDFHEQREHELQDELRELYQKHEEKRTLADNIQVLIEDLEIELLELEKSINESEEGSLEQDKMIAELDSQLLTIEETRASLESVRQEIDDAAEQHGITERKLEELNESQ
ncbi:hypothetical protein BASA61_000630 [Batrachochytrium salamandrivorans]|nr:hypothetical protein BASA62_009618 [Batrachochytrium salamandrivorans]KAH6602914.1 hypothetical protein BASA61_000630 [Batrachochytrium salamandrivorans]